MRRRPSPIIRMWWWLDRPLHAFVRNGTRRCARCNQYRRHHRRGPMP